MATGSNQTSTPPSLKPNFEVTDESFSTDAKAGYHLSIVAATDWLACSVLDKQANKFIALQEFKLENDESFTNTCNHIKQQGSDSLYSGEYRSVSAALVHPQNTLVPTPLFDEKNADKLLQFNHGEKAGPSANDHLQMVDAENIYALPENISTAIQNVFPNVQLYHFSTPLLENLMVMNKQSKGQQIFVHLLPARLCVTVLNDGKLILYNTYPQITKEDIVYYILNVMEQLELNAEEVPLTIWGEIQKSSELYKLITTYVREVRFGARPANVEYSLKLAEVPGHYYYHLFDHPFLL